MSSMLLHQNITKTPFPKISKFQTNLHVLHQSFVGICKLERIITLAKHYPDEFGGLKLRHLSYKLDTFIILIGCGDPRFSNLKGIGDLAEALVNANLVETYSLMYILVK
ncbi:uncharacterized protein LOC132619337 [Lycium barbarum]|uniref:uncharacterized protein LOC132619337 n=1 Tax=Lycium barbarum TaxID=112863 RepID=UPI00293E6E27|nr:uncharacterized protein LOC132619337 [Lycium barbarum]